MKTKNVNKLVIIPLVFILVLTLSITYALFTKEVNTNNRNITLSSINKYIGIYGPNKNNIELNKDYTFTIENRGSIGSGYEIYIESETNIDLSSITYQVTGDIIASGNLSNSAIIYSVLSSDDKKTITLRLTSTSTESYIGKIKVRYKEYVANFDYTGGMQMFNSPTTGNYKLETWGASGGNSVDSSFDYQGGFGAYAIGTIKLTKASSIYILVGGAGKTCSIHGSTTSGTTTCPNDGGYNGGGITRQYTNITLYGSGGGATHIALTNRGLLKNYNSYRNEIIMVAGGGGGASYWSGYTARGGNAGGISGSIATYTKKDRNVTCTGGNQTTAGTGSDTTGQGFGVGGSIAQYVGPGGGSGWFGGGTSEVLSCGGSSYIGNASLLNKHMACYNCATSTAINTKTESKTCYNAAPLSDCAKVGNGYARITYIEE